MSTVMVKGQDVRVGDDLWCLGAPHRVTRIEPYTHPVVTRGEQWRIAYSDGPERGGKNAWGMTLHYDHGWAASYEISARPGEPYVNAPPADDYLSPFYGEGAALWERFAAEGSPGLWRDWMAGQEARGLWLFMSSSSLMAAW